MPTFEQLFGQPAADFHDTIVLTPFLSKGLLDDLGVEGLHRGNPFASGNNGCLPLYTRKLVLRLLVMPRYI